MERGGKEEGERGREKERGERKRGEREKEREERKRGEREREGERKRDIQCKPLIEIWR